MYVSYIVHNIKSNAHACTPHTNKKVNDISEYTYIPWNIYVGESYLCTLKLIGEEGVYSKEH